MKPRFGTAPTITLDGQRVEGTIGTQLLSTTIVTDLNGPGSCEVVFSDPERSLLDRLGVDFGQSIEVNASAVEDRAEKPVFVGTVYGLEFQADESGCVSIVQAYDASYALRQQRAITAYNDMTDAELVRTLCGEAGVDIGTIEGGDSAQRYLAQFNESHWDFLRRRAVANGARLHADGDQVHFQPIPEAGGAPDPGDHQSTDTHQLTPGRNVLYLRARMSASQLTEEVEVRGWDPVQKTEVTARQAVETASAVATSAAADVAAEHGTALRVAGRPSLATTSDCESLAGAYAARLANAFTYLEGKAYGDPGLVAGQAVSIGRSGRFDGRYTLSSARHVFDQDGYFTYVTVSGEHDRSLFGLTGGRGGRDGGSLEAALYPAVVTNINDPDKLGRVKVTFPWLSADFESNWSRVMQIGAGPERGLLIFPEVDDEVLVSFIGGDASHPVVLGGLFNGVDKPPSDGFDDLADGTVDTRSLRSRVGHGIVLNDKGGEEKIVIETSDQSVIVTLDQAAGGAVTVEADGDVTVNAKGAVAVDAGGDLTATAKANVSVEATGNATLKAGGNLTLEASGVVEIKGAVINLN